MGWPREHRVNISRIGPLGTLGPITLATAHFALGRQLSRRRNPDRRQPVSLVPPLPIDID
jgi:hypothetical protein